MSALDLITEKDAAMAASFLSPKPVDDSISAWVAAPMGVKRAWDIGAEGLAQAASPLLEDIASTFTGETGREWVQEQTKKATSIVEAGISNPQKMGVVANLLYQAGMILPSAVVGGAVAGTPGAMAAVGAVTGRERQLELKSQGVDEDTALLGGAVSGVTMAVGVGLAPYYGLRTLTQVASGVGINVSLGGAERYATSNILENAGYDKIAGHYKTLDGMAIAADAVLGAAFPLAARAWKGSTSHVDAAMENVEARQADTAMPVLPADSNGIVYMKDGLDDVTRQMLIDGKSPFDLETRRLPEGAENTKLAAEMMETQRIVESVIKESPELNALNKTANDLRPDDFDVSTQRIEGEKAAETYDAFMSDNARKIIEADGNREVSFEGDTIRASDMQARIEAEVKMASEDAKLINIATACAINYGN